MTDPLDKLGDALKRQTPPPSEDARERALRIARENFSKSAQGSADEARHISNRPAKAGFWNGVTRMFDKLTTPKILMATSAIATVAIAVVITQQIPLNAPTGVPVSLETSSAPRARPDEYAQGPAVSTPEGSDERADSDLLGSVAPDALDDQATPSGRTAFAGLAANRAASEKLALDTVMPEPDRRREAAVMEEVESLPAAPSPRVDGLVTDRPLLSKRLAEDDATFMPTPVPPETMLPDHMESNTEKYPDSAPSSLKSVADEPVSTFSIDVDTASYAVVRSSLNQGRLPPKEAVRIEELVNYFDYDYPAPESRDVPFATSVSIAPTPWNPDTRLMHIGIQGYDIAEAERPPLNLVFLIDTSGSMQDANKLPLLVRSFKLLLDTLREDDSVAIVTYAGSAGTVLEPTPASQTATIMSALDQLHAGGSTAGQAGLQQAYALAEQMTEDGEVSRVILATDGDFNVGISDPAALEEFISDKRDSGTYLSVLGFGRGNYNDAIMQSLAQNGNGTAAYIDTLSEAQKVLVEEASGALFPIAGDVKIQVEFNPAQISEYRLIGYETRALNREDFNNDAVDAGEIGAGHTVTAIYEITPKGSPAERISDLRYGDPAVTVSDASEEYAFLKLRYKLPGEDRSILIETPVAADRQDIAPGETEFAAAVAGFGELLRGSHEISGWDFDDAVALASAARGDDPFGYRAEFLGLARLAKVAR